MKNLTKLLLVALIPFMLASCIKAEPNLRAVLNLQGPVKSCKSECANVTFNEYASTMTYDNIFGEVAWSQEIKHRKIVLTALGEGVDHSITFSYDKKGRLEKIVDVNTVANTKVVTKYKYENDELLPMHKSVKGLAEGKQKGEITYESVDKYGNWTKATWNGTTYTRKLTYFKVPEDAVVNNCPTDVIFDEELFYNTILSVAILAAFISMTLHMLIVLFRGKLRTDYSVNYFVKKRVAKGRSMEASEEENQQVINLLEEVYDQWQTVNIDGNEIYIPYSGSVVRKSYAAIKEAVAIAPTNEKAVELLNAFSDSLNNCMARSFNGSKLFIGISIAIGALFGYVATPLFSLFVGCGIVLYILASRKATWQECKDYVKGRNQRGFINGIIAGLLGGVATARTFRTVTKWSDGTTTVEDDHSETWVALIFLFIGCVILSVAIYIIAAINYLRNYLFYI